MAGPVVTRQDVLDHSKGMLQKQLYVIFTTPTAGMEPVLAVIDDHLKFQVSLEERGIMVGAGPFWTEDEKEWKGEGMVIVRAGSLKEAKEIADSDPMHKSGARSYKIRSWLMNEGTFSFRVSFSSQKVTVT